MSYAKAFEEAKAKGRVNRLTSVPFRWEEGKSLIGKFVSKSVIKSTNKNLPDFNQYLWETDEGPVTCIMSSAFDAKADTLLAPGRVYCITYRGKIPISKGHTYKVFDVERLMNSDEKETGDLPF